ncbi:MAG: competence/damage-inducible protein A [Candidatus Eremiobacteraeota bacterium]|nr:competence/damage-inducible protein A [Candidatus Eremiobacteraeota bacterium]
MSLSVEIVTIGTEILLGHLVDTNSVHISRVLADHGVDVYQKHSVGDNAARLEALLRGALERAGGVIATGGLGPTVDDLTKPAVAAAVGATLEFHEPSLRAIEARFASLGRTDAIGENNRRQALLPAGAFVLENPHGTAPGFVALRPNGKFVACMPGVPREMKPMLAERLVPWLVERYGLNEAIFTRTLHTVGIAESDVDRRIEDVFSTLENPKIAVLAHEYRVDVKIMAKAASRAAADAAIEPVERELRERIGPGIFGADEQTLEGVIVAALAGNEQTLATAESITGGAIADAIVRVPGASRVFRGGIVAYDNGLKESLLDVNSNLVQQHGAVSEEVASAMARGARRRLGSSFAIASTGIAGPGGATEQKPVGLVYLAVADESDEVHVRRVTFLGSREDVRRRSVVAALNLLWRQVEKKETRPQASTSK